MPPSAVPAIAVRWIPAETRTSAMQQDLSSIDESDYPFLFPEDPSPWGSSLDINSLSLTQLKKHLKARNRTAYGPRASLRVQLKQALKDEQKEAWRLYRRNCPPAQRKVGTLLFFPLQFTISDIFCY